MADPFVAEIRIVPFNFAPTGWAFCDGQPILRVTVRHRCPGRGGSSKHLGPLLVREGNISSLCGARRRGGDKTRSLPHRAASDVFGGPSVRMGRTRQSCVARYARCWTRAHGGSCCAGHRRGTIASGAVSRLRRLHPDHQGPGAVLVLNPSGVDVTAVVVKTPHTSPVVLRGMQGEATRHAADAAGTRVRRG